MLVSTSLGVVTNFLSYALRVSDGHDPGQNSISGVERELN